MPRPDQRAIAMSPDNKPLPGARAGAMGQTARVTTGHSDRELSGLDTS